VYRDVAQCAVVFLHGFLPVRQTSAAEPNNVRTGYSPGMVAQSNRLLRRVEAAVGRKIRREDVMPKSDAAARLERELRYCVAADAELGRALKSVLTLNGVFAVALRGAPLYDATLPFTAPPPRERPQQQPAQRRQPVARTR
jgi:hypothetical protein